MTTPVVPSQGPGATGIVVQNNGVQVGGALTTTPQTTTGAPLSPNAIPIGAVNSVVAVIPPTHVATPGGVLAPLDNRNVQAVVTNPTATTPGGFASITGAYAQVAQTNANTGAQHALIYRPHGVDVALIPANHGDLAALGVTQTTTQRKAGAAVTALLPAPHERPQTTDQARLVAALYPPPLGGIDSALDSLSGRGEDPTLVNVLDTCMFQDAMDDFFRRLRDGSARRRAGAGRPARRSRRRAHGARSSADIGAATT